MAWIIAHYIVYTAVLGKSGLGPNTWLIAYLTFLTIYPWTWARKIKLVSYQVLGQNHVLLRYKHVMPSHGVFIRLSLNFHEWHAFGHAGHPTPDTFQILVARAGDWTERLVDSCDKGTPNFDWWVRKRGYGFVYTLYCYRKVLVVATGGGIAPVLPFLVQKFPTEITILWIAARHVKVYGQEFCQKLQDSGVCLFRDTKIEGRPSPQEIRELAEDIGAEATFVVSNEEYTVDVVCEFYYHKHMIPCYGATWDS